MLARALVSGTVEAPASLNTSEKVPSLAASQPVAEGDMRLPPRELRHTWWVEQTGEVGKKKGEQEQDRTQERGALES